MPRTAHCVVFGVLVLAGCQGYDRPRELRGRPRPDDPRLTIAEQEERGRARYAIPEDDFRRSPDAFIDRPSPTGR